MVFSINAVESGPNNFGAFKTLAMRGNSGAIAGGSPSGSATSGAPGSSQTGAAAAGKPLSAVLMLSAIGAVAALL